MTIEQIKVLGEIIRSIVQTVKECPDGAPAGPMYAALMSQGCTLSQFESLMGGLVRAGKLRKSGDLYFAI